VIRKFSASVSVSASTEVRMKRCCIEWKASRTEDTEGTENTKLTLALTLHNERKEL
jgi:hypothetical protein